MDKFNELSLIKMIIKLIYVKKRQILLWLQVNIRHRSKNVRMSFSYLFSIKVDNKYLLIKGGRIEQYQPIGGVFKYTPSFQNVLNTLEVREAPNEQFYDKHDLRIILPSKNVSKLVSWFHSRNNRESTPRREFIEELVDKGPLDSTDFEEAIVEFRNLVESGLRLSVHFEMLEYNIYEIYSIRLSEKGEQKIRESILKSNNLILVDEKHIRRENYTINDIAVKIGAHSKYIL